MSNESGETRLSSSSTRHQNQIVGIPKHCWRGESIVVKLSKSDRNPYRRYFRCRSLSDNHDFKWVDDAIVKELEVMKSKIVKLGDVVKELSKQKLEFEKVIEETVKEKMQRLEDTVIETQSSSKMKNTFVVSVGGIVIMCLVIKWFV